jgi:LysM repeat protein
LSRTVSIASGIGLALLGLVVLVLLNRPDAGSSEHGVLNETDESVQGMVTQEPAAEASAEAEASAAAPAPEPVELVIHEVQAGESLWLIGERYGCAYPLIMAANELSSERIRPGQELTIPDCSSPEPAPVVEPQTALSGQTHTIEYGDFLETIATRYNCSVSEIMQANSLDSDSIYAGQTLQIPTCEGTTRRAGTAADLPEGSYLIASGDTLGGIAQAHGCSIGEIQAANQMASDRIRAGDHLLIPACTGEPVERRQTSVQAPSVRSGGDLAARMRSHGFRAPRNFKASVVVIDFNSDRTRITQQRSFEYENTGDDVSGWNPASAIKIFSAVAAAERANELGFSLNAQVVFHGRTQNHTFTLRELIGDALGPSNNIAHNFLVQFAGFDALNARFFSARNGFQRSAIMRAYETSNWMRMGEAASFRSTPAITISEGGRSRELPATNGDYRPACGGAACTSVEDLGECMRRLMLHEQLPESERFDLDQATLSFIRRTLRSERSRGEEVVDRLAAAFDTPGVSLYHKAGFAGDWFSDNVYITVPGRQQAYVVSMAAHPGRSSLNGAATAIGEILAAQEL